MNNAQAQTANTDKQPIPTDVSSQAGISLLTAKQPADRGEAFSVLKKVGLTGSGKWFNAVMNGYQEQTGIELQKSENGQAKAVALKWAHNASKAEVESVCATASGEGHQFWVAWGLHKEGKWPDIDTETVFQQHFKAKTVDEYVLAEAIKTLNAGKPTTRGEAFNLLKDDQGKVNSTIYTEAVKAYEETAQTVLSHSTKPATEMLNAKAHGMSAEEVKEHIASIQEPDPLFWKLWRNCKEGAHAGQLNRKDFEPAFKSKGQAPDNSKVANQKQSEHDFTDDIPF